MPHCRARSSLCPGGIDLALLRAKDPAGAARRSLASAKTNLLINSDFSKFADRQPANWWVWQDEKQPAGTFACDPSTSTVRLTKMFDGCFGQNFKAQPGERYAVAAKARHTGHGVVTLRIGWKSAAGKWTRNDANVRLALADHKPGEWQELAASVRVPEDAATLIVMLHAAGQADDSDQAWFKDIRLVKFDQ